MNRTASTQELLWRRVHGPDFQDLLQSPGLIEERREDGVMYLAPVGKGTGPDQQFREVAFKGDLSTYWIKDLCQNPL